MKKLFFIVSLLFIIMLPVTGFCIGTRDMGCYPDRNTARAAAESVKACLATVSHYDNGFPFDESRPLVFYNIVITDDYPFSLTTKCGDPDRESRIRIDYKKRYAQGDLPGGACGIPHNQYALRLYFWYTINPKDSDGDGVYDSVDQCPGTPAGETVDPEGCSCEQGGYEDTDGDGIGDACDNCPDDPNPDQHDSNEDGVGDACECDISLSINKAPLFAGDTAVISADITGESSGEIIWTISPADALSTAEAKITSPGRKALIYDVRGEGWLKIRAQDPDNPECYKEAMLEVGGCTSCSASSGGGSCDRGGGFFELSSVDAHFSLGKTAGGESAGNIFLRAEAPDPANSTPQVLKAYSLRKDTRFLYESEVLRQVIAPETFVDIVVMDDYSYQMRFYSLYDMGNKVGGFYGIVSGAVPFVTWKVENPDASPSVYNRLRITEIKSGGSRIYEYIWDETLNSWSLSKGDGAQIKIRKEEIVSGNRVVTEIIKDAYGDIASKTRTTYKQLLYGSESSEQIIEIVQDPDGEALTTTKIWYEDTCSAGSCGRIKLQVNPDGSWTGYEYDSLGRKIVETASWLDALAGASASSARATYYEYTPQHSSDTEAPEDEWNPRVVTETILGNTVGKIYYVYQMEPDDTRTEIVERAASPTASYGDSSNLRTITVYYPFDGESAESGKMKTRIYPDGRMDTYTYENGIYSLNSDPSLPGMFTPGNGEDERETVIHGTIDYPSGIADKTTGETTINDRFGRQLLTETSACNGSGYDRIKWTMQQFDASGHVIEISHSNGTRNQSIWGCCTKESDIDESGAVRNYTYDELGRLDTSVKEADQDIITSYTYDAAGRQLTKTVTSGGLSLITQNDYDRAGRLIRTLDQSGLVTDYGYSSDGLTTTVFQPGGATEITSRYRDGRIKSVTGTGVVERYYTYGINSDGTQWTKINTGSAGSSMWEKTMVDMLGRTVRHEKPGYTGTEVIENFYNSNGELERTTASGSADVLYEYDSLGSQIRSGLDMNQNSFLDESSGDRISETESYFTMIDGSIWQETVSRVYAMEADDTSTISGIHQSRLTGLGAGGLTGEEVAIDIHGNQTSSKRFIDRTAKTETQVVDYPDSETDEIAVSVNGLLRSSQNKTGVVVTYTYDDLGRRTGVIDPRTGKTSIFYHENGWIDYMEDPAGNKTHYTYDSDTGQKINETKPFGRVTRYAYNSQGQVTHIWGGSVYPVKYSYDSFGRMTEMHTFRGGSGWDSDTWPSGMDSLSDVTRWHYQDATGLLLSKEDAKGFAVSYTYAIGGKVRTRTWARTDNENPLVTAYTYDPDTGELVKIDYSDSTPDIYFAYDRLGRQDTVTDALGTRSFTYNAGFQPESESISGVYNRTITRTYETEGVSGRSRGFSTGPSYSAGYNYDGSGRINSVSWNTGASHTANYTYVANSDLIHQMTADSGYSVTYGYEDHRNLKTQIKNEFGAELISQVEYQYDESGQRISASYDGKAVKDAAINKINGAAWFEDAFNDGTGIEVMPDHREYEYDPIGNRKTSVDWSIGIEDYRITDYGSSSLNQYDQKTETPGPITDFEYDKDGNLISVYTGSSEVQHQYNAENRLIRVAPVIPSSGDRQIEFVYDYMGRRVQKIISYWNGSDWTLATENLFVYDGWNLIEEITMEGGTETSRYYVWGLDLSQSLQGAGGVGGLLALVDNGKTYHYGYDGNGNAVQLVNAADGTIAAHYEYDPFGNLNYSSGAMANDNPFRFSTKYYDLETGLYYYGYRYYSPELGRWITKDPIAEKGSNNIYAFVGNNSINRYDVLGLWLGSTHRYYTFLSLNDAKNQLPQEMYETDRSSNLNVFDEIYRIMGDANVSVDTGLTESIMSWHFNRILPDDYESEPGNLDDVRIQQAINDYAALLNERKELLYEYLNIENPSKAGCEKFLEILGQLSHIWQDYYAHAIRRDRFVDYSGGGFTNIAQKWGGVRDVGGIEGNPDSIGPNMKPSTWLSRANTGEHGASEPGSRLPDCGERQAGMRTFVAGNYETYLKDWWDACQCVWRKK